MSRPPSRHNRSYCAVCHEGRRPSELPVRDLRRIDPKRTTDFDDEYADSCDSMCRCWEDDFVFDYDPPAVVFSLGERLFGKSSSSVSRPVFR